MIDEGILTEALGLLAQPVGTLLATREGHGAEAADLAAQFKQKMNAVKKRTRMGSSRSGFVQISRSQKPIDPVQNANCRPLNNRQTNRA